MSEPKVDRIRVKIGKERLGHPVVVVNDQDDAHPGGHILIRGDDEQKTFTVGNTRRIRELIEWGHLEQIGGDAKETDAKGTTTTAAPKP